MFLTNLVFVDKEVSFVFIFTFISNKNMYTPVYQAPYEIDAQYIIYTPPKFEPMYLPQWYLSKWCARVE